MSNILKAEDLLQKQSRTNNKAQPNVSAPKKKSNKKPQEDSSDSEDDGTFVPVQGRIASGRFWKTPKKRAISAIKTPGLRGTFAQKQKLREDLKRVKEMARAIEQERIQEKLEKKRRREENLRRAEENRKKNEIVQVIKKTDKIKKMRKTQLRKIEKRDVTKIEN